MREICTGATKEVTSLHPDHLVAFLRSPAGLVIPSTANMHLRLHYPRVEGKSDHGYIQQPAGIITLRYMERVKLALVTFGSNGISTPYDVSFEPTSDFLEDLSQTEERRVAERARLARNFLLRELRQDDRRVIGIRLETTYAPNTTLSAEQFSHIIEREKDNTL